MKKSLTHLDGRGACRMVSVADKDETERAAVALTEIVLGEELAADVRAARVAKGDVLAVARVAGIMAAKRVPDLIPLCHPVALDTAKVSFLILKDRVVVRAEARSRGRTGVEMEALTAASVAALAVYDMCKGRDKGLVIGPTMLAAKSGGKSGDYRRAGVDEARVKEDGEWL